MLFVPLVVIRLDDTGAEDTLESRLEDARVPLELVCELVCELCAVDVV